MNFKRLIKNIFVSIIEFLRYGILLWLEHYVKLHKINLDREKLW